VKILGFSTVENSVTRVKHSGWVFRKWLPIALAALVLGSGCTSLPRFNQRLSGNRAFIKYWPPDPQNKALRVAIKDNIDMTGVITTAGSEFFLNTGKPAKSDARCLAIARQRNVRFVGKTNLTEFAVAPSGLNEYFGTPENPFRRDLIPGGSSSGNAVALSSGMADVAIGTDTAGSIRVPAACCGIVGLKTTHGLISVKGIYPIDPHLDTVGPMGKDIAYTVQGMDLLQGGFAAKYAAAKAAKPTGSSIRVGRLKLQGTDPRIDQAIDEALAKAGFKVVQLDDRLREKWEHAKNDGNTIAAGGVWYSDKGFIGAPNVTLRTKNTIRLGQAIYNKDYRGAVARQAVWQHTLSNVFAKVDFIALPTLQKTPPELPLINLGIGILEAQVLALQNTVPVSFAGNPALAVPVPLHNSKVPLTSLQLIGPPMTEAGLLNAGRLVENAVNK
jgi:amidase